MEQVGIFFGSTTGNTELAAKQIQKALGDATVLNVMSSEPQKLGDYANVILGASTWGMGDLQDDFQEFLDQLGDIDLTGKKVAIYGFGDQSGYPDTFVDGMGDIYEAFADKGCELIGQTETAGYDFDESRAEIDGRFVGLVLDEENQDDMHESRISEWTAELKKQFN